MTLRLGRVFLPLRLRPLNSHRALQVFAVARLCLNHQCVHDGPPSDRFGCVIVPIIGIVHSLRTTCHVLKLKRVSAFSRQKLSPLVTPSHPRLDRLDPTVEEYGRRTFWPDRAD